MKAPIQEIQTVIEDPSWQDQVFVFADANPWAAVVICVIVAVVILVVFKDKIRRIFK